MHLGCPHCHQPNEIPDQFAGLVVACVHCRQPFSVPALVPAAAPSYYQPPAPEVVEHHHYSDEPAGRRKSRRSRLTYVLLALFFGVLGVHNFYAGRIGVGLVQLFISWTVIGTAINLFWCLVELFVITHDADGREMR